MLESRIKTGLTVLLLASLVAWWRWQSQEPHAQQSATAQAVGTEQQNAAEDLQRRKPVALTGPHSTAAEDAPALPIQGSSANHPPDVQAQVALGDSYLTETRVKADPATAAWWSRQAADQGDAAAQANVSDLYEFAPDIRRNKLAVSHLALSIVGNVP